MLICDCGDCKNLVQKKLRCKKALIFGRLREQSFKLFSLLHKQNKRVTHETEIWTDLRVGPQAQIGLELPRCEQVFSGLSMSAQGRRICQTSCARRKHSFYYCSEVADIFDIASFVKRALPRSLRPSTSLPEPMITTAISNTSRLALKLLPV
jgi:hypothetical protein